MNDDQVVETTEVSEGLDLVQEVDAECETGDILSYCSCEVKDGRLEWTCQNDESKDQLSILLQNELIIKVSAKTEEQET